MQNRTKPKVTEINLVDAKIRATCATLESVAKSFPKRSAEYKAIEEAARAYLFLQQHEALKTAYHRHVKRCNRKLSAREQRILQSAGVRLETKG